MSNELTKQSDISPEVMQSVLLGGDIAKLSPAQKVEYMLGVCKSLGLNPTTKPFEFLRLNGKETMYARKDCTEQLRKVHGVSIKIVARETVAGCYVVTAQATDKTGKVDESLGAVPIEGLKGEMASNAMMKAETKAKRRVTLSICGLGMLDESEVDSIPGAQLNTAAVVTDNNGRDLAARDELKALYEELKEVDPYGAVKTAAAIKHSIGGDFPAGVPKMKKAIADARAELAKEPESDENGNNV